MTIKLSHYLAIFGFIIISIFAALLFVQMRSSETPQQISDLNGNIGDISQPVQISTFEIIDVNNPFDDLSSSGMKLSTSDTDTFEDLIVTMDFIIDSPTTNPFDGDFKRTVMGETSITSYEKVSIEHRLLYVADSVVTWTQPTPESNLTWNQPPDRVLVPSGSEVIVTYTTKDASDVWVGDVVIDKSM